MNFKKAIATLLTIVAILFVYTASAQINYADVKVDDLTDAQIRQLIQRAESIGYSDAQLEQMAAAQGMSQIEIVKLRTRVEKIRRVDGTGTGGTTGKTIDKNTGSSLDKENNRLKSQNRSRSYDPRGLRKDTLGNTRNQTNIRGGDYEYLNEEERSRLEIQEIFEGIKPKIFGEDLFKNADLTFEPNLRMATPKSYVIGPDDELLVDLTGDNEASYQLYVSTEGTIRLQYVGLISVGGLTIEQATSKIRTSMTGTYPGLRTGRTQVAINLGNIRSIRVTVVGEVVKPGSYTVPSLFNVFNVLYQCGGPNQNGSFRKIQVLRNNKVVSTVDVYDFLLNGVQKNNIRLQDQDVINVPVYENRVEINGEVKRPAFFELLSTESFSEALRFAGGFSNRAYTGNVKILQNTSKERRVTDVSSENFASYTPRNGDKIIVEGILDRFENRVEIVGSVFRPGIYELENGLTLKALIGKADGVTEDAFLNRGYISRLNPDNSQALLSFDVAKILSGSATDIALRREDKVTISSIFDLREEYEVSIQGEVREPGAFDYAEKMTLEALIQMAGGFKEGATPNRIEISRRIRNSDVTSESARTAEVFTINVDASLKIQEKAFELKPFDIVSVRGSEGYQVQRQIKIEGEVVFPGTYTIARKNERISDVIKRAGGLTPWGYAEGASLKRPGKKDDDNPDSLLKKDEERYKLLNLRRLQQDGAKDTTTVEREIEILRSDLVGISLDRILKKPGSRLDLFLEDGDVIHVPKELQTVRITGEVLKPNNIIYVRGKSFRSYIYGAGGFTYNAYRKGAYVVYSNGSVASAKKFFIFNNYPEVKPGSEIFVPKRAERERMTTQGWIGISTAFASLAAIVVSLLR